MSALKRAESSIRAFAHIDWFLLLSALSISLLGLVTMRSFSAENAYFERQRNGDLFLNAVSWLAEDTDLMAIRPRDPASRRINLTLPEANFLFYFAVILMPGLAMMSGIGVWWKRRG